MPHCDGIDDADGGGFCCWFFVCHRTQNYFSLEQQTEQDFHLCTRYMQPAVLPRITLKVRPSVFVTYSYEQTDKLLWFMDGMADNSL